MCPHGGPGLLEGFRNHMENGCRPRCFDECRFESSLPSVEGSDRSARSITTLAELEPDQHAVVTRVQGEGTLRRRLMDLGILSGTPITMERSAPLGDPLEVLVRGTHLSLRREEAAAVQVRIDD